MKGTHSLICALVLVLWTTAAVCALQPADKPKNIVLIGWDGAQMDHVKECLGRGELPNLKKLSDEGSFVEIDIQGHQTETEPGFAQILTGYDDEVSGVLGNEKYSCIPKGYTIFERIEEHFGADNVVTVGLFSKGHRFKSDSPEKPYYNAAKAADIFRNGLNEDKNVTAQALKMLEAYKDRPFFFFVQFAGADRSGHDKGENSVEYNDALITYDKLTGSIADKLKELGLYDKTIIYVTADHGFDEGSRGHSFAPYVFMATNDPRGINRGFQADVTPTVLDRFGVDLKKIEPPYEGKPLTK
ncbi:MAG: alkaline phosphatase [Candidatus Omnitrophota bacterium]